VNNILDWRRGTVVRLVEGRLSGLEHFDGAEALEWTVDEEHLDRDIGLDVRLGEKREDLAVREPLDQVFIALGHHALEVLAHCHDPPTVTGVHHRLLERREPRAAHHAHDDVVERVRLGFERPAAVVLAEQLNEPGRDRRQQAATGERCSRTASNALVRLCVWR
jgi:hypothetical protein